MQKIKNIISILFLVVSLLSSCELSADEVQGHLLPLHGNKKILHQGEVFDGLLRLWPVEQNHEINLKKLIGTNFLDFFHIVDVLNERFSPNNPEALEIVVVLTLIKPLGKAPFYIWANDQQNIPIELKNMEMGEVVEKNEKEPKYVIFQQPGKLFEEPKYMLLIAISSLVLLVLVGYLIHRYVQKRRNKEEEKRLKRELTEKWDAVFQRAKGRDEFEFIYKTRQEWDSLAKADSTLVQDFFEALDENQYKEVWSESALEDVTERFEKIRNIIRS